MAQPQHLPRGLESSRVLLRFGVSVIVLTSFAAFGSLGFGRSLATLMWIATLFSAVVAVIKHERPCAAALNHWDEMLGYAAMFALVGACNNLLPP